MLITQDTKAQFSPITPTNSFPFNIVYFDPEDIGVQIVDPLGNTTTLTLDSVTDGFSVTPINGDPQNGATINTTSTYTTGQHITIFRLVPVTQLAEFSRGGDLPPIILNKALDRGIAVSQQITDIGSRHLLCPITDPAGTSYELPSIERRRNTVAGFDDFGNAIAVDIGTGGGLIGVDTTRGLNANSGIVSVKIDDDTIRFDDSGKLEVSVIQTSNIATDSVTGPKIPNGAITKAKLENVTNLRVLGNTSGAPTAPQEVVVLDEQQMSSDSSVALATQRSIKSYVDTAVAAGGIVQIVHIQDGSLKYSDTAPQISNTNDRPNYYEGLQVMSLSINPTVATNKLKIDVTVHFTSAGSHAVSGLFRDGEIYTSACAYAKQGADTAVSLTFSHIANAGTTGTTTFKVRIGGDGNRTTFNGDNDNNARYGGGLASSITISEIKA